MRNKIIVVVSILLLLVIGYTIKSTFILENKIQNINEVVINSEKSNENTTTHNNENITQENNNITIEKNNEQTKIVLTPENVTAPTSVNGILIVNKKYPLPKNYNNGEDAEARKKIDELIADGQKLGLNISNNTSGFRSYETQRQLYNNYVANYGKEQADTFSARAGYSEHQSGLAFDLIDNQGQLLGATGTSKSSIESAKWVEQNAHYYGFIVRYKENIASITGYNAEPWHLRYVGQQIATEIYNRNISLEEYLGVEGGDYREN